MKINLGSASDIENLHSNCSTPSTPGTQLPPIMEQESMDEPIHIINVSLRYKDLVHLNDTELSTKCYLYAQVSIQSSITLVDAHHKLCWHGNAYFIK